MVIGKQMRNDMSEYIRNLSMMFKSRRALRDLKLEYEVGFDITAEAFNMDGGLPDDLA